MNIVPRENYDHPGPLGPAIDLSRVTGWDIHHTAGSRGESVHSIAETGVSRFGRSSYNFAIPDEVYEMQGLHIGAHNDGENSTRLGIVFPGYYHPPHNHRLTKQQINNAAALIAFGNETWGIPIHAKGHRATDPTSCPGDTIVPVIPDIIDLARGITVADNVASWAQASWDWAEDLGLVTDDSNPKDTVEVEQLMVFLKRFAANLEGLHGPHSSGGGGGLTVQQVHAIIEGTTLNP